jgi:hypothetical protein
MRWRKVPAASAAISHFRSASPQDQYLLWRLDWCMSVGNRCADRTSDIHVLGPPLESRVPADQTHIQQAQHIER